MVGPYLVFLGLLAVERGLELWISRRHGAWALARGGIETGRGHLRAMQLLHGSFLAACAGEVVWLERPFIPALAAPMLVAALAAQALRYWAVTALGMRWNVRVIALPGMPAVSSGPYRYLRHPNYLAVIVEGIAVPLVHGAWLTALAFSAANAWLLRARIRCEEQALAAQSDYAQRLGDRPRLLPRLRPGRRARAGAGR
jgi:methyltransferase